MNSNATDLSIPDLQVQQHMTPYMKINHSYEITLSLHSSQNGKPLSALEGSVVNGQTTSLSQLLGDTPCASASLLVDPTFVDVEPSQPQEYSLQQSQITWIWNITPLPPTTEQGTFQQIPVELDMFGKEHCGSGDPQSGPYPLAEDIHFTVIVSNDDATVTSSPGGGGHLTAVAPDVSSQGFSLPVYLLPVIILLLLFLLLSLVRMFCQSRKIQNAEKGRIFLEKFLKRNNPNEKGILSIEKPFSLFYCYAPEDRVLRDKLHKHLTSLEHAGWIQSWFDGMIRPGTVREEEIRRNLETADIILLLVSSDFIASAEHYNNQMEQVIERHEAKQTLVIPVILRPSLWERTLFGSLQPLPTDRKAVSLWKDEDEALLNIASGINSLLESLFQEELQKIAHMGERNTAGNGSTFHQSLSALKSGHGYQNLGNHKTK